MTKTSVQKVGSGDKLKTLLEGRREAIEAVLPKHLTGERLLKVVGIAASRTPKLYQCTQGSLIQCVMRGAELGLDMSGTMGEAYLVPYGNEATFIIGYRGFMKLARQSGEIDRLEAEVVRENDLFNFQKGSDFKLQFVPATRKERGEPIGAYAYARFRDGGEQAEWMSLKEINGIRNRSKAGKSGPWQTDWSEMARKTVFRRLAKWLPMANDPNWDKAIQADNATFEGGEVPSSLEIDVTPPEEQPVVPAAGESRAKEVARRSKKPTEEEAEVLDAEVAGELSEAEERHAKKKKDAKKTKEKKATTPLGKALEEGMAAAEGEPTLIGPEVAKLKSTAHGQDVPWKDVVDYVAEQFEGLSEVEKLPLYEYQGVMEWILKRAENLADTDE